MGALEITLIIIIVGALAWLITLLTRRPDSSKKEKDSGDKPDLPKKPKSVRNEPKAEAEVTTSLAYDLVTVCPYCESIISDTSSCNVCGHAISPSDIITRKEYRYHDGQPWETGNESEK